MTVSAGIASLRTPPALERRFGNFAGSWAYRLYVPSGYDGQPVPLVVILHGRSQTARDFAIGTRMGAIAEEQGFLAAYLDQPSRTISPVNGDSPR